MAVIVRTTKMQYFIESLKRAVSSGCIRTWQVDELGDYTISRAEWRYTAWMRPYIMKQENEVIFGIVQSKKYPMTKELYGVYHGRFIATLLSNFDTIIDGIEVTPMVLEDYDIVKTECNDSEYFFFE